MELLRDDHPSLARDMNNLARIMQDQVENPWIVSKGSVVKVALGEVEQRSRRADARGA